MFDTIETAHVKGDIYPLTLVVNEPFVKKEVCSLEAGNPSSIRHNDHNYAKSPPDSFYTIAKAEILDDASFPEDENSVSTGRSAHTAVKTELDIGPTELQPPDMYYMLQSCKPDPECHEPLQISGDIPQGHELLMMKTEEVTQRLDDDLLMHNSLGSLPRGACGPMSQKYTQRVEIVPQPAHTDTSKITIPHTNELLAHTPGVPALRMHHGETQCNSIFTTASNSSGDNYSSDNSHSKKFSCEFCYKVFFFKSNLLVHMRLHNEESSLKERRLYQQNFAEINPQKKRFECKFCGKECSQSSHLDIHTRVHTREKPFDCELCGKTFSDKSTLAKHMRVHTGEKPFECSTCGKRFSQRVSLSAHMAVHTGEKPFECKSCCKRFSHNSTLITHTRVHTGEKPFECKSCGRKFSRNTHLNRHLKSCS